MMGFLVHKDLLSDSSFDIASRQDRRFDSTLVTVGFDGDTMRGQMTVFLLAVLALGSNIAL